MNSLSAFRPMIQTQQEDREWKQQVDGLQNELQTFTKQTEVSRQQVETLQQNLFLLRYNLMCLLSLWMGDIQQRRNIRTLTHRQKGLLTFPLQTRRAHFTALNDSHYKSFTRNACKRSWQCAMEETVTARQCAMEIWPHSKFGLLSSKLLNQNVL